MIKIVYYSGSGNTLDMANAIAKGITDAGKEAQIISVSDAKPEDLQDQDIFALGCPAMGAEVLEEMEMEPFVEEVCKFAGGKKIALFGSYGWGDGEWMRNWEERMQDAGAELVGGEGIMCNETPDDDAIEECEGLGQSLAML